jgi:hypothetical protein
VAVGSCASPDPQLSASDGSSPFRSSAQNRRDGEGAREASSRIPEPSRVCDAAGRRLRPRGSCGAGAAEQIVNCDTQGACRRWDVTKRQSDTKAVILDDHELRIASWR